MSKYCDVHGGFWCNWDQVILWNLI